MKKYHLFSVTAAILTLILALPVVTNAQMPANGDPSKQYPADVGTYDTQQGTSTAGEPAQSLRDSIRARFQNAAGARLHNLENNRDYRNSLVEGRPGQGSSTIPRPSIATLPRGDYRNDNSTSSRPFLPFVPPAMRRLASTSPMLASSTFIERILSERGHKQSERADAFVFLQSRLIDQLNQALDNLKQIRGRIALRVQTETGKGIDMTDASNLLAVADRDIATADQAIQALANYVPPAGSDASLIASTTVDLDQARQLGSTTMKSVNDVQKALNDVVQAIIKATSIPQAPTSTP